MSNAPLFWNLARASGFVAYGLLAVTVLFGLTAKTRVMGRLVKPAAVVDIHRVLSLLALGMVALHGAALVLDPVVEVSPLDLLVPGILDYRPLWTAFGIVAAYLALAVHASFSLRKRIGARNWRRLHWLTYAVFLSATVHGIATGTDTAEPWALVVYGSFAAAVAGATCWRALGARAARGGGTPEPRPAAEATPGRRAVFPALLAVGATAVVAGGVLANITLLDAARPADVPVGSLAPLAASAPHTPPERPAVPAPASPAPQARADIQPTDDIRGADDDD